IREITDIAVFLGAESGETNSEILRQWNIDGGFPDDAAALTDVKFGVAAEGVEFRPRRMDADRAADRVAAEQETLRTSEDFRALKIVKRRHDGAVATLIKSVLE